MNKNLLPSLLLMLAAMMLPNAHAASTQSQEPAWQYPVIKGYGGVLPLPKAELQPSRHRTYKVVFHVTQNGGVTDVNAGLAHMARAINVFAAAHVPLKHLKYVVVISGPATEVVLDNDHYRQRTGHDNPDAKLIDALDHAGVHLVVCGQALAEHHIDHGWVDPKIHLSLSALSDVILLQQQGYALIPM